MGRLACPSAGTPLSVNFHHRANPIPNVSRKSAGGAAVVSHFFTLLLMAFVGGLSGSCRLAPLVALSSRTKALVSLLRGVDLGLRCDTHITCNLQIAFVAAATVPERIEGVPFEADP